MFFILIQECRCYSVRRGTTEPRVKQTSPNWSFGNSRDILHHKQVLLKFSFVSLYMILPMSTIFYLYLYDNFHQIVTRYHTHGCVNLKCLVNTRGAGGSPLKS